MRIQSLANVLKILGYVLGASVVGLGVYRFAATGSRPSLLVALAVLVVGPLEDLLKAWVERTALSPENKVAWSNLIDQATSVAFLLFLLQALTLWVV